MNLRRALRTAQNGDCPLCNCPVGLRSASIDHVIPKSKGGGEAGNYFLAHRSCNTAKGDRMPTELELRRLATINRKLAEIAA